MQGLSVDFHEMEKIVESSQRLLHPPVWHWAWGSSNCWGWKSWGFSASLSSRGLSMGSLQHGGFRAAKLATQPPKCPQAFVLSERTRWKLYHFLRPSLESHIALLLLCIHRSPPKEPTQFQRGHLLTRGGPGFRRACGLNILL